MSHWRQRYELARILSLGLAASLCGSAMMSCAGDSRESIAPSPAAGDFGLPRPSDLPREARFIDVSRKINGSLYQYIGEGFDDHASPVGDNVGLEPVWNTAGTHNIQDAARAGFKFNLTDYDAEPLLEFSWATPPSVPGNLWVGVANWGANRWDWRQYAGAQVDLGSIASYQSDPQGIFVALVLLGTDPAELEWVRIGPLLWETSVVDSSSSVGRYDTLALDSMGQPHISYWDETNKDLKYAYRSGTSWQVEAIDSGGDVGQYTCLALDGADHPHISYLDDTNHCLKYATNDGSGWAFTAIDPLVNAGYYTSIALDSLGHPHIACFNAAAPGLSYASFDGLAWSSEVVDPAGTMDWLSLVIDSTDHPHIAFHGGSGVEHAFYDGVAWSFDTVYAGGSGALSGPRVLALGPGATLRLVFYDNATIVAHLGVFSGGGWSEEALPFGTNFGTNASLAVDGSGLTHMTFYAGGMVYARNDGSSWHRITVDNSWAGWNTSLALNAAGNPCVSYCRPADNTLCYAEYVD